jgi:triosephosphate isomerase (TIM)
LNRRLVLGNWKMNTTCAEAVALATGLANTNVPSGVDVGIAPPFPWLEAVARILNGSSIRLGAQTCSQFRNGAYTGEVAASMLRELCQFVIVGHSERRALFGDTDDVVRDKILRSLEQQLEPVVCVGETESQRDGGSALQTVRDQLASALDTSGWRESGKVVVAYEPVWAIGTGKTATPVDAAEMCRAIREQAQAGGAEATVLYGGSVNPGNAGDLMATGAIDGFLVGGASLKVDDFQTITAAAGH